MRLVAIFPLVLVTIACGRPIADAPPEPIAPPAHLAGTIGPVDGIDADATATVFDDGEFFSATVNATHGDVAVMARVAASNASTITVPMARSIFTFADDSGISAVGCAGSAEGQWDIVDLPAEVVALEVDEAGIATVTLGLRDQTETVTASFATGR